MKLLNNQTAVIYGGSGKLGASIAREFHKHGSNVAIHYFSNATKAEKLVAELDPSGKTAFAFQADSTDEDSLINAVQEIKKRFERIDSVVNTIHKPYEPVNVAESKADDWKIHLEGLVSQHLISKTVIPIMREQNYGRIVYVSAALAVRYSEGCSMYTAIKRGLNGFCRTLAMEEGKNNIMVNIVCPGGIADAETQSGEEWDKMTKEFIKKCCLGRFATSQEIANACIFFASPLGDGITGQTLYVSGGEIML